MTTLFPEEKGFHYHKLATFVSGLLQHIFLIYCPKMLILSPNLRLIQLYLAILRVFRHVHLKYVTNLAIKPKAT